MPDFTVGPIDHVELFVPDRYAAAAWYGRVFGLSVVPAFEHWAETVGGPLMISSDGGATKLALFEGEPPGDGPVTGFQRVAFQVDGPGMLAFLARLDDLALMNRHGARLTRGQLVDHDRSWSIYFRDPWGNPFEITTYGYVWVKERLAEP